MSLLVKNKSYWFVIYHFDQWMHSIFTSYCGHLHLEDLRNYCILFHRCYTTHHYQCISPETTEKSSNVQWSYLPVYPCTLVGYWKFLPGLLCITWPAMKPTVPAHSHPWHQLGFPKPPAADIKYNIINVLLEDWVQINFVILFLIICGFVKDSQSPIPDH